VFSNRWMKLADVINTARLHGLGNDGA
jgi:hypothetical protein